MREIERERENISVTSPRIGIHRNARNRVLITGLVVKIDLRVESRLKNSRRSIGETAEREATFTLAP